ncbi:3-isopropylmalate dehydratase large subunit [Paramuribaculum intestinale]|uniref:3-isopropylmalate dehydratase large subunit n=8 Tax=Paramuribaculum intestinale TaxID=2094151 RepID=A0A2V1IVT4_9BACT|nr:3-isopropylmalate dehydratase large subunit [Paramuribaculum intestinale]MBJ2186856.1 3-isopropylmalate dehydratase large subunit [Muribaculaceae bacterium]MCX4329646.1 3-isopropylmalate dehydratase large subunit [Paramuribaculum intestinale]PWB07079.1 3-isopropylmalate dehydratase large subunit [Paramuribaculum intestinale]PWB12559.1 3-isopropylmalate dehydratase large subunit [Paramuribaculum intestinale]WLT43193.1 3-isopropylmalate dehydratase large subunit [Paramuribaculum intestinale]
MGKTLFDKIWDAHTVTDITGGPTQLYIDRHYCHEVTSPQAFDGLRGRGLKVRRPDRTFSTPDHNIPTLNQDRPIADPVSARQVDTLLKNAGEFGITLFPLGDEHNGIIHVMGPENGLTLPGSTIVCGDSHTSTHGAFGAVAFGIGTSEVEMVLATQCILQPRPKTMRITVDGRLGSGVTSKDMALYIIAQLGTGGATGYFVEYAGDAVRALSMEQRMTLCNLSIEMGARGGMIAPDQTTFDYLKGREFAPSGKEWDEAVAYWRTLPSDDDAVYDREVRFDAADIEPRVTYGTNPGMGIGISEPVPLPPDDAAARLSFEKALAYMGFRQGESLEGQKVDYVFLGSCTNGRIEDFRAFASYVKGRRKHPDVTAWLVPGSWKVRRQISEEGLDKVLEEAGFEIRQPGCSACLAMNDDKVPAGCLSVSTSNRNFEGRQGPGARTVLAGPLVAAAAAVHGVITDPRKS